MKKRLLSSCIASALLSLTAGNAVADLDEGLVAYYPFDGNALDASGNEHHGTVHGATLAEDRFGNPNSAYRFDGIDDHILVGDQPNLRMNGSFTVTAWVKSSLYSSNWNGIVEGKSSKRAYSWMLRLDTALKLQLAIAHHTGSWEGATDLNSFSSETWTQVVGTWNSSTNIAKVYKNGVEVGNFTQSLSPRKEHDQGIIIGHYPYENS